MTFIGASLSVVSVMAVLGLAGLLVLQWLKTRYPARTVSSTMLWAEAMHASSPRFLWSRFARFLSLLLSLGALGASAMAALEPVWESEDDQFSTVIVYEAGCEDQALDMFGKLSPLHRKLVWAEGGGIVTGGAHQELAGHLEAAGGGQANLGSVAVLAERLAGGRGLVVWLGGTPPPQLPATSVFVQCSTSGRPMGDMPPLRVRVSGGDWMLRKAMEILPGLQSVDHDEQAECLISLPEDKADVWEKLDALVMALEESGLYGIGVQSGQQELPRQTEYEVRGTWQGMTGVFLLVAMLAYVADLWLWNKGRIV